jgi:chromosome segregation ATPase
MLQSNSNIHAFIAELEQYEEELELLKNEFDSVEGKLTSKLKNAERSNKSLTQEVAELKAVSFHLFHLCCIMYNLKFVILELLKSNIKF